MLNSNKFVAKIVITFYDRMYVRSSCQRNINKINHKFLKSTDLWFFFSVFLFLFFETNNKFLFENYFAQTLVFKTTINNESDMVFFHISHSPTAGAAAAAGHKKNKITIYFRHTYSRKQRQKIYIYKIYMIN